MPKIRIDRILPNPDQPRTRFDEEQLAGLAQSMQENGLVQAITVERAGDQFILIDGERRWRAAKRIGWDCIEAVIREPTDHHGAGRITQALVANVQRSDLGLVDEARVYQRLMKHFRTMAQVARRCGVSEATVSGRMALLQFPEPVQALFNLGSVPFDLELLAQLKKLPADRQIAVVTAGAARGWNARNFRLSAQKALEAMGSTAKPRAPRRVKEIQVLGHFDALALVEDAGNLPALVINVAHKTCEGCPLYPEASRTVCKLCPLPEFLTRLNKEKIA